MFLECARCAAMRLLELFCGTKSVGQVAHGMKWEVISLDILKKYNPSHLCDIADFDEKQYSPDYFDFVWASPPCTEFSVAKTVGWRDIDGATALVRRTREIIQYFNPRRWVIENPVGLLRHQPVMDDLSHLRKTVSYCRYGFPYRKNTDLWTNIDFQPLRCAHGTYCDMRSKRGKHDQTVQQNGAKRQSMKTRYAIPSSLIYDLLTDPSMTQLFPKSNIMRLFPQSSEDYVPRKTPPHTPTPGEWRRMVIPRSNLLPGTVRSDVYYWTPSGKRMRSKNDVRKFLHENQADPRYQALKVENFDFSRFTKQDVSMLPILNFCHFCYLLIVFWSLRCYKFSTRSEKKKLLFGGFF